MWRGGMDSPTGRALAAAAREVDSRVVPAVGREGPALTVLKFTLRMNGFPAADDSFSAPSAFSCSITAPFRITGPLLLP